MPAAPRLRRLSAVRLSLQLVCVVTLTLLPVLTSSAEEEGHLSNDPDRKEILRLLRDQQQELADQRRILREQDQKIAQLTADAKRASSHAVVRRIARRQELNMAEREKENPLLTTRAVPSTPSDLSPTPIPLPSSAAEGPLGPEPALGQPIAGQSTTSQPGRGENPSRPVGVAPAQPDHAPEVQAIADVGGVLTKKGTLVVEPYSQYIRSTLNNFSFQGVQIVNAFLIGQINANRTSNDLAAVGATARYGITNRLEGEVRVPYIYRDSHVTQTTISATSTTTSQNASGGGIGDVEAAVHYQVNSGQDDWPFFIANLRYKSDSGKGPFDVGYNSDGSAQRLPTGSGFNAIEPSLTVIYPSDPAVLFANVGWIKNFGGSVNKTLAGSQIGDVTPGDTYQAAFGVGVALNDRLSFTLGYEHDYIQGTREVVNNAPQTSTALQVGQALLGMSFKANPTTAINVELAAGVTRDAPDAQLTVRVPLSFDLFGTGGALAN